jgi:hypothetical protein
MKRTLILLLGLALISQSCSRVLMVKKIELSTNSKSPDYYINDERVAYGGELNVQVYKKNKDGKGLTVKDDGYKDHHDVLYRNKFNPGIFISIGVGVLAAVALDYPQGLALPVADLIVGSFKNFPKKWHFELEKEPEVKDLALSTNLRRITIDTNTVINNAFFNSTGSWDKQKPTSDFPPDIIDNIIYHYNIQANKYAMKRGLNNYMGELGLQDTTHLALTNFEAHSIDAYIVEVNRNVIRLSKYSDMINVDLTVQFKFHDKYGVAISDTIIKCRSGNFKKPVDSYDVISDALDIALLRLLNVSAVSFEIEKDRVAKPPKPLSEVPLASSAKVPAIDNWENMAFHLLIDDAKSIGLPIGKDGLIAFSKSGSIWADTLLVQSPSGKTYVPEVIYENLPGELLIVKIDSTFEQYFQYSPTLISKGKECLVMGYDSYYKHPLFAKGIVNGTRVASQTNILQIDALTSHLTYPALLDKNGTFYGFISRSYDNFNINAISFCPIATETLR